MQTNTIYSILNGPLCGYVTFQSGPIYDMLTIVNICRVNRNIIPMLHRNKTHKTISFRIPQKGVEHLCTPFKQKYLYTRITLLLCRGFLLPRRFGPDEAAYTS